MPKHLIYTPLFSPIEIGLKKEPSSCCDITQSLACRALQNNHCRSKRVQNNGLFTRLPNRKERNIQKDLEDQL